VNVKLVANVPLDTQKIANLISDPDDLHLVWPIARQPFDHEQWKGVLDPEAGHTPFLLYDGDRIIGHAGLCKTEQDGTYSIRFMYIVPDLRSGGIGSQLVRLIEQYAHTKLQARKLTLVVRTYNPRARRCYEKCGFVEEGCDDTLIRMGKVL
jgi:RimJ/RimL family protein N-acetyltransferase